MRKSCAPSARQPIKRKLSDVKFNSSEKAPELLINQEQENRRDVHNRILYNVLWRKKTTKKHKTWEGDALLELRGNTAVIKSDTGVVLGSCNTVKSEELIEGHLLVIDNKEYEIQDQIHDATPLKIPKVIDDVNSMKTMPNKAKLKDTNHRIPSPETSVPRKAVIKESNCVNELILPSPNGKWRSSDPLSRALHEVRVTPSLLQHLRPHQRDGVCFLYDCIIGFKNPNFYGAILADEMGLGKTLQCLVLCHTLLKQGPFGGERVLRRVLIVTPCTLTATWNNEIDKWLKTEKMFAYIVNAKHQLDKFHLQAHIPFVIASYDMFLRHSAEFKCLDFDLVICDEGHRLKNNVSKISCALQELNIQRRIILTGTPIQNNLKEFFVLADFVNPGILGSYQDFKKEFENPILQGQAPEANDETLQRGKEKADELKSISSTFILRRLQDVNKQYLPGKKEYIVFIKPSELQQELLIKALAIWKAQQNDIVKELKSFQIISVLAKICDHPALLLRAKMSNILIKSLASHLPLPQEMGPFDSAKLDVVRSILSDIISTDDRIVIVSNRTKTLDMLEELCEYYSLQVCRLDGKTLAKSRQQIVARFNNPQSTLRVFLLSAKAGGMGLNLCGASRLILYDNDWNPAIDKQALSRIWRDGQSKQVKIYRLVTVGTIEEKILQRQIMKTSLGKCAVSTDGEDSLSSEPSVKLSMEELSALFEVPLCFDECGTHNLCSCACEGKDSRITNLSADTSKPELSGLTSWKHYSRSQLSSEFLKDALLPVSDSIILVFCHQVDVS